MLEIRLAEPAVAVAVDQSVACVLSASGRVQCWGDREWLGGRHALDAPGKLSLSTVPAVDLDQPAVAIEVGDGFACALLAQGDVACWGRDHAVVGWEGDDLSRATPPVHVALGAPARAIAAGWRHVCALLLDGAVKCWGDRTSGLGLGTRVDSIAAWPRALAEGAPRRAQVRSAEVRLDHPAVRLPAPATALSAGWDHTCALLVDGRAACWGAASAFQPDITPAHDVTIGDTDDAIPGIDVGGRARSIRAGAKKTCVLLDDGSVRCWGVNGYCSTGVTGELRRGPVHEWPPVDLGSPVTAIEAGKSGEICAVLESNAVKCWGLAGLNAYGEYKSSCGDDLRKLPGLFEDR